MNHPIRLAIVDDYAVVIAGVASLLGEERIDVVETGASMPVISDVDIVLYDTFGQVQGRNLDLKDFVRDSGAKVVIYSWNLHPDLIAEAIAGGASGYLSKVLTGPAIVAALERIMSGEIVILAGDHESSVGGSGDWPGRSAGLSPREAEVLALIARGLKNQEIADRAYLSINSIKTYIRSAYRKIGVDSRTQAVLWAVENGFPIETARTLDPALDVMSRHVGQSADWWLAADGGVGSVVIVEVEPAGKGCSTFGF
jgi:two-component system, NarL family, response regulator LiaR